MDGFKLIEGSIELILISFQQAIYLDAIPSALSTTSLKLLLILNATKNIKKNNHRNKPLYASASNYSSKNYTSPTYRTQDILWTCINFQILFNQSSNPLQILCTPKLQKTHLTKQTWCQVIHYKITQHFNLVITF